RCLAQCAPRAVPPTRARGVPARDEADELVALMLGHLLRRRGIPVRIHPVAAPLDAALRGLEHDPGKIVFISPLPPSAVPPARHAYHRLHARALNSPVVIGIW